MNSFTTLTKSTRRAAGTYIYCIFKLYFSKYSGRIPSNLSTAAMNHCVGCQQYSVTYTQSDKSKFSTRESSGKMLKAELNAGNSVAKVDYWACSREEH